MFLLSSSFSSFNDVVVLESTNTRVVFGSVREIDQELKIRLKKSCDGFFARSGGIGVVSFRIVSEEEFKKALVRQYGFSAGQGVENADKGKNDTEVICDDGKDDYVKNTILLLDSVLDEAVRRGATDVHIEEGCVRFRVCGVLEKFIALSKDRHIELVRRIKVLSKLNVMETRRGQDGQFVFLGSRGQSVFVRVSVVPAVSFDDSEAAVLRILDVLRVPLELSGLGFTESQRRELEAMISCENGLVLISGPTGSGKSTTAASLLCEIQRKCGGGKKIITIEDPVEYLLSGVTQIKVNEEIGMSFEESLRLVFRQDPDVIFVGEIRDEVTAKTVMRSSLTGHLVLATVHTTGFYETILRLHDLGCEWNEIFSVLRGIVSQRLTGAQNLCADIVSVKAEMFDGLVSNGNFVCRKDFDTRISVREAE
ncbi:MAG: Flp pilus assembly complex ATPase component TadA [Treponema sp.]|nr:Flp pilus assembly complex ATPase component TadA [Treponema sp.]